MRSRLAVSDRVGDALIVLLFIGAELEILLSDTHGSRAALYLFPIVWTLPLLLRRRWPIPAALTVLGALAIEGQVTYHGTETQGALIAAIVSFYTLGRRAETSNALIAWALATVLGGILIAADKGPLDASALVFLAVLSVTPFAAGMAMRTGERETEELEERARRLEREQEEKARAAVAEERTRIARELHDMVGHAMSVISVQAGAARLKLDSDPESARAALEAIEDTSREALGEMRRLIGILRDMGEPALAPQPGLAELDRLVQGVRDSGLPVELELDGTPTEEIPPAVDLAAYRIVQEALTNALKHGGDGRTLVRVSYAPESVAVAVESHGGTPEAAEGNGQGLVGMRERVELCGGTLDTGSIPGGFAVRATLPLESVPS